MAKDKTAPSAPEPELTIPKNIPNAPQADFHITVAEHYIRTVTYIVPVERADVVADLKLTPDQTEHWGANVHSYVPGHWNELKPISTIDGTPTETLSGTEFTLYEYRGPSALSAEPKKK